MLYSLQLRDNVLTAHSAGGGDPGISIPHGSVSPEPCAPVMIVSSSERRGLGCGFGTPPFGGGIAARGFGRIMTLDSDAVSDGSGTRAGGGVLGRDAPGRGIFEAGTFGT